MKTGALTESAMSDSGTRDRLRNDLVLSAHAYLGDECANGETEILIAMRAWVCFDLSVQLAATFLTRIAGCSPT